MELRNGMLVKHETLGVGKIVGVDRAAVHVVFATHDARTATKLRLPMALAFLSPSPAANTWLSSLTGFVLDEKSGRYGRVTSWLSHTEALERFTQAYPGGFSDPTYTALEAGRAGRWRRAGAEYASLLGNGEGERLLKAADLQELVDRTRKVEKIVRTLIREEERVSLEARLEDPDRAAAYFKALFEFVGAARPHRGKFEALASAVIATDPDGPPEAAWPMVTMLPFVARPDLHGLMRPRFAADAMQRLGMEIEQSLEPSFTAYSSLLTASSQLLEKLAPIGAKDHVDVEVFVHTALAKPGRPKSAAAVAKATEKSSAKRKVAARAS